MRITEIREKTVPLASPIANAYIDFTQMTCSVVAVITDVVRNGKPVVGYGFNSNGRYGQGCLIRERFQPRILAAVPKTLIDAERDYDAGTAGHRLRKQIQPLSRDERAEQLTAIVLP
jgi:D(-)-tartrate dehydratase